MITVILATTLTTALSVIGLLLFTKNFWASLCIGASAGFIGGALYTLTEQCIEIIAIIKNLG